jgi:hypothetical protein
MFDITDTEARWIWLPRPKSLANGPSLVSLYILPVNDRASCQISSSSKFFDVMANFLRSSDQAFQRLSV